MNVVLQLISYRQGFEDVRWNHILQHWCTSQSFLSKSAYRIFVRLPKGTMEILVTFFQRPSFKLSPQFWWVSCVACRKVASRDPPSAFCGGIFSQTWHSIFSWSMLSWKKACNNATPSLPTARQKELARLTWGKEEDIFIYFCIWQELEESSTEATRSVWSIKYNKYLTERTSQMCPSSFVRRI